MSDPNIAEKYYGKLKAKSEEAIADFVWKQAMEIKQLQTTNQQLVEALERAYKRLDTKGADVHNVSSVKSIIQQAITNAKQLANKELKEEGF